MTHSARSNHRYSIVLIVLPLLATALSGCGNVLQVEDPTAILESQVSNAQGAELLRRDALAGFYGAVGDAAWDGGLLADEFIIQQDAFYDGLPFPHYEKDLIDRRAGPADQAQLASGVPSTVYGTWQSLRGRATTIAIDKLERHAPPGARGANVGEMFAVRAWIAMRLAEDFCPGFPLNEVRNYVVVFGKPTTNQEAFEYALVNFDSAMSWAVDSVRVLNFAKVGKARALLQLGRFAEAANIAASIPTAYTYRTEYSANFAPSNPLASSPIGWSQWGTQRSIADREGGNGLDFISANDPRVPTIQRGTARDGRTLFYVVGKYAAPDVPITVASGLEARLIEAEAALQAGDPKWLTILNDLRATQITPALTALSDPGTAAGRVNLLFRERAFWLFATGTRLGDLRRLIRLYGRTADAVFPQGTYWRGGNYGPASSLPIGKTDKDFGAACTSI